MIQIGKKWSLIIIILSIIVGCNSKGSETEAQDKLGEKQSITISWPQDIGELNPHAYSPNQMFAQNLVYEPLVTYGTDGSVQPHLAEDWTISEDGREYTFLLRENVLFSDGTLFTAEVAKRNLDLVIAQKDNHNWLELVNQLEEVIAEDDYTLVLKLKNPYYPMLQELALVRPVRFMGENGFAEGGTDFITPIGTGPWVLKEYRKNEMALFERNEAYWGEKPKLEELIIKVIPDGESRVIAFENGEIDLIYGNGLISLDSYKFLRDSGQYQIGQSDPIGTRAIVINSNRGTTTDVNVRQAIIHGINTKNIVSELFYGTETVAETLFATNVPYSDVGLIPYEYNVEKAIKLLEESGWYISEDSSFRTKEGSTLQVELSFDYSNQIQKSIAELMQGELRQIGIDLVLVGEESQSYYERQKTGKFNMTFNDTWGAPYDPHSFVSSMRTPSHADFMAQLGLEMKPEIDKKISEVLITTDEVKRQEIYNFILKTLHEQAIYLPISYTTNIAIYHDHVNNVEFSPVQYEFLLEQVEIK